MDLYERLKVEHPTDGRVYERIAAIYSARGKYSEARWEYEALLDLRPRDAGIKEKIAELLLLEGNNDAAINVYETLMLDHPDQLTYYAKAAEVFEDEGRLDSAIGMYRRAERALGPNSLVLLQIGRIYEQKEALLEARKTYEEMIPLDPLEPLPWVRLGVLSESEGSDAEAAASFRRAVELGSDDPLPYYRLSLSATDLDESILYARLAALKAIGRIEKVKGELLLGFQSGEGMGLRELAELKRQGTELEEPEKLARQSLSRLAELRGPDLQGLDEDLSVLLTEHPKNDIVLETVGSLCETLGLDDRAVSIWTHLATINPRNGRAHLGLARVYRRRGNRDEAVLAYKRAIDLDSGGVDAYQALIELHQEMGTVRLLEREWENRAKVFQDSLLIESLALVKEME
jgi:Flp pilus assembly protein TadD